MHGVTQHRVWQSTTLPPNPALSLLGCQQAENTHIFKGLYQTKNMCNRDCTAHRAYHVRGRAGQENSADPCRELEGKKAL